MHAGGGTPHAALTLTSLLSGMHGLQYNQLHVMCTAEEGSPVLGLLDNRFVCMRFIMTGSRYKWDWDENGNEIQKGMRPCKMAI